MQLRVKTDRLLNVPSTNYLVLVGTFVHPSSTVGSRLEDYVWTQPSSTKILGLTGSQKFRGMGLSGLRIESICFRKSRTPSPLGWRTDKTVWWTGL